LLDLPICVSKRMGGRTRLQTLQGNCGLAWGHNFMMGPVHRQNNGGAMHFGPKKGLRARTKGFARLPDRSKGGLADAKRSYERYMALARSAASSANAIEMENYYQHADHYYRLMREQSA
jgi:hypothetical protein